MDNKDVIKDPQIYISKDARVLYDDLRKGFAEFKQMENKDFFMLLVFFGYLNKKTKSLPLQEREKSGFSRERYLDDHENAILKAIAIAKEKKVELIGDIPAVYSIAEEYANGGVRYLKEFVYDNPGSFIKKFAVEIKELVK